jgi:hypothetical protein
VAHGKIIIRRVGNDEIRWGWARGECTQCGECISRLDFRVLSKSE